jgi:hypothetical protein
MNKRINETLLLCLHKNSCSVWIHMLGEHAPRCIEIEAQPHSVIDAGAKSPAL